MLLISQFMPYRKIISSFIFIIMLFMQINCAFLYAGSYSNPGFDYYSMNFESHNMGVTSSNGYIYMWNWPPGTTYYHQYTYYTPILTTDAKLRTHELNLIPQGTILVFNSTSIYLQNLSASRSSSYINLLSWQQIYSRPVSVNITNSCFGVNTSEIFILILDNSLSKYQVIYNMQGVVNKISLTVPVSSANNKMVYKNNTLYISFQTGIQIFSVNSSLILLKSINFPTTLVEYDDVAAEALAFGYSYNQTVYILSTVDFRLLWQTTLNQTITGITIASCYLVVYANPYIYQIDLEQGQVMYSINYSYPGIYLVEYIISSKSIFLYQRENAANKTYWRIFNLTADYNTSNYSCLPSYTYNSSNSSCLKIFSNNIIINHINLNASTGVTNQSQVSKYFYIFSSLDILGFDTYSQVFGKALIVSSFRITPNFLLAFTFFLDDLFLYRYHRRVYPVPVQWFTKEVNIINQFRQSIWFLDVISVINTKYVFPQQNKQRYRYLNFTGSDPEDVYFLYSSEDVYQGNLLLNLIIFSLLRVLSFIANSIEKQCQGRKMITSIIRDLKNNAQPWVLFIAILENNMIKLSFNCFLQLLSSGLVQKQDKLNVMIAYSFLLALILYSLSFYPLIYARQTKRCSSILLIKYKCRLGGFYIESLNSVCRNLMKGFVHSFFIANYPLQISLLAGLDLIFFFISIRTFKYFRYKVIGVLCVLYYFFFFVFDLYFCLRETLSQSRILSWDPQQVSFIILATLASLAILISIGFFLGNIFGFVKFIFGQYISYYLRKEQSVRDTIKREENNLKKSQIQKKSDGKQLRKKKILIKNSNEQGTCFKERINKIKSQRKFNHLLKIQNCSEMEENKNVEKRVKKEQMNPIKQIKRAQKN